MSKKIRSAKGVLVDFDQLRVKQQLAEKPSTTDVKARQEFIEKRKRRRAARKAAKVVAQTSKNVENIEESTQDDQKPRKQQTRKSKNDNATDSSSDE